MISLSHVPSREREGRAHRQRATFVRLETNRHDVPALKTLKVRIPAPLGHGGGGAWGGASPPRRRLAFGFAAPLPSGYLIPPFSLNVRILLFSPLLFVKLRSQVRVS